MNDKEKLNAPVQGTLNGEDPEIFGRSRSREEIRADEKAERARQREQMRQERRASAEQKRSGAAKTGRKDTLILVGVLAFVVIVCVAALAVQLIGGTRAERFEMTGTAHYLNDEVQPELSADGVNAVVNEMYYTKGGYLCVRMTLGNGSDEELHMQSLLVTLTSEDTDRQIARGYTAKIDEAYTIPANGNNGYTFYLSPEHVSVTDDALENVKYEIEVTTAPVE